MIFSYFTPRECVVFARVCQIWLEPALIRIYSEIDFKLFAHISGQPISYDLSEPNKRRVVSLLLTFVVFLCANCNLYRHSLMDT